MTMRKSLSCIKWEHAISHQDTFWTPNAAIWSKLCELGWVSWTNLIYPSQECRRLTLYRLECSPHSPSINDWSAEFHIWPLPCPVTKSKSGDSKGDSSMTIYTKTNTVVWERVHPKSFMCTTWMLKIFILMNIVESFHKTLNTYKIFWVLNFCTRSTKIF